ncbi:conserved hypothetical protein [Luminiphilus syltensis NOR5-1B]|uniref:Uncharacterized protein n=1 Tax=Luminiphilus syltensis NOR5-1B TaxID=565045 RepID=B8KVE7_9GAMM|nr:hypothetical protein [Luminiphilus syltensis]EED36845.1 conserved hypothetical protein [Luminiphilus syltensis NOR5-1B]
MIETLFFHHRVDIMRNATLTILIAILVLPSFSLADSTGAACVIYPADSDQSTATLPCRFYQAQGHVVITRSDGVEHDLLPVGETDGTYSDASGDTVYRQSDLGDQGLIFRFPEESVYVYWNTSMLEAADPGNPTEPFTTDDYDATALFRCKVAGEADYGSCPGGILRMAGGEASIVVLSPAGDRFTINFMADYVNATNREVSARLEGDIWMLEFDNGDRWEIPLAAIEGG